MERDTLKKIIELTTIGDVCVWGQDQPLGTMDELIDQALDIIKNESKNNEMINRAGIESAKAEVKLRKIMNEKDALIESALHDDRQSKDHKHYDPINKKFVYFNY